MDVRGAGDVELFRQAIAEVAHRLHPVHGKGICCAHGQHDGRHEAAQPETGGELRLEVDEVNVVGLGEFDAQGLPVLASFF